MGVIIQGSARSKGNTGTIAKYVAEGTGFEIIELCDKNIGHFDYDFKNKEDDYLPLMRQIIKNHETMVFATPVYWYSMSGLMKDFFDRFTDLLRAEKELGRKLKSKNMAMISCGSDRNLPEYFTGPFEETAGYLGMNYLGDIHTWIEDVEIPSAVMGHLDTFIEKLK